MRLHRTISPDLPLLVVALEEEAAHLHVSELPVLVTGAGKVNAAVSVATILGQYSPSHLVNLGTAGALHDGLEGTHVIGTVIQHDLDDAALFQLSGLHFGEPIVVDPHASPRGARVSHGRRDPGGWLVDVLRLGHRVERPSRGECLSMSGLSDHSGIWRY